MFPPKTLSINAQNRLRLRKILPQLHSFHFSHPAMASYEEETIWIDSMIKESVQNFDKLRRRGRFLDLEIIVTENYHNILPF